MAWTAHQRRFALDALLVALTGGLWLVWWVGRHEHDLRARYRAGPMLSAPLFLAGGATAATARLAQDAWSLEPPSVLVLSIAGILACTAALLAFTETLAAAAARARTAVLPPWVFPLLVGVTFAGVELGNALPDWRIRIPVLALLATLVPTFYRVHQDTLRVRDALGLLQDPTRGPLPRRPLGARPTS